MSQNTQTLRMPQQQPASRNDRDEFIASYLEMLTVMRRLVDMYGEPNITQIVARADAALGRVPR